MTPPKRAAAGVGWHGMLATRGRPRARARLGASASEWGWETERRREGGEEAEGFGGKNSNHLAPK